MAFAVGVIGVIGAIGFRRERGTAVVPPSTVVLDVQGI